jgi:putative membrane protein insertion efficiency factor
VSVARETGSAAPRPVARETTPDARPLTALVLLPIRFYRRFISPALGPRCRYYPTCSTYAEEAVRELGPVRGMILAAWRVLRCNPLSRGGLDPLAERRLFRTAPSRRSPSR